MHFNKNLSSHFGGLDKPSGKMTMENIILKVKMQKNIISIWENHKNNKVN